VLRCNPLPSIDVADALLDERRELTGRATGRHENFHKSRCNYFSRDLRSYRRIRAVSPNRWRREEERLA
jgi:hypothetical protein